MEDFNSETDSDYTSYWRDWVSLSGFLSTLLGLGVSIIIISFALSFSLCSLLPWTAWHFGVKRNGLL